MKVQMKNEYLHLMTKIKKPVENLIFINNTVRGNYE